jgi:hypothetical protein
MANVAPAPVHAVVPKLTHWKAPFLDASPERQSFQRTWESLVNFIGLTMGEEVVKKKSTYF